MLLHSNIKSTCLIKFIVSLALLCQVDGINIQSDGRFILLAPVRYSCTLFFTVGESCLLVLIVRHNDVFCDVLYETYNFEEPPQGRDENADVHRLRTVSASSCI
jgi:hypothetical protein